MEQNGSWWRGTRIAILEKEIELAEQKMEYSIAMKPIIKYMQKRLEEENRIKDLEMKDNDS